MARYDIPPSDFDVAGARIGIVAARFNDDVVSRLLEAALDTLACHGLDRESIPVARVPGAFELPLAARWLATRYDPLTDARGPDRSREDRRIVHGDRAPGDEHVGDDDMAAARSPKPATSTGRERDDPSAAVRKPRPARNTTAARNATADAVIALGAVIRGDTPHFDYVCAEAARGLRAVSLELDVPVVFGVLTCDDYVQARERAGGKIFTYSITSPEVHSGVNKGREAALAALEMVSLRRRLGA